MKILYASIDSVQEAVGQSQIIPTVVHLSKMGHMISLLTFEKREPDEELVNFITSHVYEWKFFRFSKSFIFGSLKRFLIIWFFSRKYDVVHARGDLTALAAILTRTKVLWDVRSFWSQQRRIMSNSHLKKSVFYIFGFTQFLLYHFSDAHSYLSNAARTHLRLKYHSNKPSIVVPTHVDLDLFEFKPYFPKSPVILFSGNFNGLYDLQLSKDVCSIFKQNYFFKSIWARPQESSSKFNEIYFDNVSTFDRKDMPTIISESSFGVALCKFDKNLSNLSAVPTKIAEFLAVGRPIFITEGLGDFDLIVKDFQIGVTVPVTGVSIAHTEKMISLLKDPLTPYRCREVAEKYFNLNLGVQEYSRTYQILFDSKK